MAHCSAAEITDKLIELCVIDDSYTDKIKSDLESYYAVMNLGSMGLPYITELITYIDRISCNKISNRGDLCALSISVPEIKEKSEKLSYVDELLTYSNPKDITQDIDELVGKIEYAKTYGFPYSDNKNSILSRVYESERDENCYLNGYYIGKRLYTSSENPEDVIYRELPDFSMYSQLCGELQSNSLNYFGELLNIDETFDKMIIPILKEESLSEEEILKESFKLLAEKNPFIDINVINNIFDVSTETGRGIRR